MSVNGGGVLGERHGHGRRARQAHGLEAGERLDVAGDSGLATVATARSRGDIEHVYRHLRARSATMVHKRSDHGSQVG